MVIKILDYSVGWNTEPVQNLNGKGLFCFGHYYWFFNGLDHWKTELLATQDHLKKNYCLYIKWCRIAKSLVFECSGLMENSTKW